MFSHSLVHCRDLSKAEGPSAAAHEGRPQEDVETGQHRWRALRRPKMLSAEQDPSNISVEA